MEVLYKLNIEEINDSFFDSIRKLFKKKDLIIKISDNIDTTDFLSLYSANEKHICDNIVAEPTAVFKGNEFSDYINNL